MIVVLVGKTASGKTTVANELCKHGYKKIVTYTTRPMRKNEKQDVDYHFISDEQFNRMIKNNEFTEYKRYNTSHGVWSYGSVVTSEQEHSPKPYVIILTPQGLRDLSKKMSRYIAFYLNVGLESQLERLKKRGDEEQQIIKRLENDAKDFENVLDIVDCNLYVDNGISSPQIIANMIANIVLTQKTSDVLMARHFNFIKAYSEESRNKQELTAYFNNKKVKRDENADAELCFRQRIEELQEERIHLLDRIDSINKAIRQEYDNYVDMANKYMIEPRERFIGLPTVTKTPKPIIKIRYKGVSKPFEMADFSTHDSLIEGEEEND